MLLKAAESFLSCSLKTQLYIVDNSPGPALENNFGHLPVEYHFCGENAGYGRAHNWAIEHSKGNRYYLIMNPDIIIGHGTIELLTDFMDKNPDIGMVCPRITNEDGTTQYLNRRYPNVLDLFARRFIPAKFHNLMKKRMNYHDMRDVGYDKICDVEFMTGSFMFCRMDTLQAVNGFDTRYFMYFEDCDLGRKFQDHGYRTVYYPHATVVHRWERASYKNLKMIAIHVISMFRYFNKWGWKFF